MNTERINYLKSIYDIDKNDGEIRQIVWDESEPSEYIKNIVKITA